MKRLSLILAAAGSLMLLAALVIRPAEAPAPETSPEAADSSPPAAEMGVASLTPVVTGVASYRPELAAEGRALFQAKGCVTCHRHDAIVGQQGFLEEAPNLSDYQPDPEFVRQWLRDPAAVRPGAFMPNLNLSEAEIEALMAFLSMPEP